MKTGCERTREVGDILESNLEWATDSRYQKLKGKRGVRSMDDPILIN